MLRYAVCPSPSAADFGTVLFSSTTLHVLEGTIIDDIIRKENRQREYLINFRQDMTWRHHIERTVAKVLCTYIRTSFLFTSGHLSINIKLTP